MKIELPKKITITETQLRSDKVVIPLIDIVDVEVKNQNFGFRITHGFLIGLLILLSFSIMTGDSGLLFKIISVGILGFLGIIAIIQFGVGLASLYVLTAEQKIKIATALTPEIVEILEGLSGALRRTAAANGDNVD